jgi:hypothetical protein
MVSVAEFLICVVFFRPLVYSDTVSNVSSLDYLVFAHLHCSEGLKS